ncbi:hypothetical protein [Ignatzschineria cameli]|uniref:Alpha/beta hydrolase n=1 Tax=Ignatzschineria cameli TaxID=2182793 RepID=A0ABX5L0G7_9GAMM|nr:hypothetical protein [Ignatzschineria cameli]PWD88522.1 hypothetical protein DC079_09325 [Ignatzschineria cameli]PWD89109.1 hypothetical protein DC081_09475 [Ignatzschineria cameli]PWD89957.1 hypothetical protein DC078_09250 [Ignatzschineria cameli]
MKLKDLKYKHINIESKIDTLYVTFAAWNFYGNPEFFAEGFLFSRNIEAVLIAQNGINHWWHTDEILVVADYVRKRAKETGKRVVLYGSSMGGYGVCHFRKLFDSYLAISIAPQIFIDDIYHSEQHSTGGNKRALEEKLLLQDKFKFNELNNLNDQVDYPLHVYYDPMNRADSSHVQCYKKNVIESGSVHFLSVPYTNHDVARALNKAKFLEKIVLHSDLFSVAELRNMVKKTYLYDPKACMNYLRKSEYPLDKKHLEFFEKYLLEHKTMDFEALYMTAEILMKLNRYEEAINISLRSIEVYMSKYSKFAPEYLRNKFKFIVKKALSVK